MGEISPLTPDTPRMPSRAFTARVITFRVGTMTVRVIEYTSQRAIIPGLVTASVLNPLVIERHPEFAVADDYHQERAQDMPRAEGRAAVAVQVNSTSGDDMTWLNNSASVAADVARQRAQRDHHARIAAMSSTSSSGSLW